MDSNFKLKIEKAIEVFSSQLNQVRAGRAASSMVESLKVEVYGTQMPLNQLATIHVPDPSTIIVQPWDVSNLNSINKAFLSSNLNLNPVVESNQLRINLPSLTNERRTELVKVVKGYSEETKIILRNLRKDAIEKVEKDLKDKVITEDERDNKKDHIDSVIKESNLKIDSLADHKINEITTI